MVTAVLPSMENFSLRKQLFLAILCTHFCLGMSSSWISLSMPLENFLMIS